MSNQLEEKKDPVILALNNSVFSVIGKDSLTGFEKAYKIASAAGELESLLTKEYMKPIMNLQGNRLGFKTDKDGKGGYSEDVVKRCLIEAVLTGVQPFGNQFNIIAENCYITKEGFGYLLSNIPGLGYKIKPQLPRISQNNNSAAVVMDIEWTINGVTKKESIDFPIKVNQYMGADAVIGKATRKARAWLFNTVNTNGIEVSDGDVQDVEIIDSKVKEPAIEDIQYLYDLKKDTLSEEDRKNAERIITNKETTSYSKLFKLLQSK